MRSRRWLTRDSWRHGVLLGALAVLAAVPGHAVDSCDLELSEAERGYEGGAFEQAMELVDACLEGRPGREAQVQALAIKTRIYLATYDIDRARETVARLLAVDAGFQPARGDSPALASTRFTRPAT